MSNSTATRKPTKRQMFEELKKVPGLTPEQVAFIDHELELLAKKNAGERKQTPTQVANEALKVAIVEGLEPERKYTVTEVIKEVPACAGLTNQKVTPLVNQLVEESKLVKTTEKRRSYFSLPAEV